MFSILVDNQPFVINEKIEDYFVINNVENEHEDYHISDQDIPFMNITERKPKKKEDNIDYLELYPVHPAYNESDRIKDLRN